MRFTVLWSNTALDKLAKLWVKSANRNAVQFGLQGLLGKFTKACDFWIGMEIRFLIDDGNGSADIFALYGKTVADQYVVQVNGPTPSVLEERLGMADEVGGLGNVHGLSLGGCHQACC